MTTKMNEKAKAFLLGMAVVLGALILLGAADLGWPEVGRYQFQVIDGSDASIYILDTVTGDVENINPEVGQADSLLVTTGGRELRGVRGDTDFSNLSKGVWTRRMWRSKLMK